VVARLLFFDIKKEKETMSKRYCINDASRILVGGGGRHTNVVVDQLVCLLTIGPVQQRKKALWELAASISPELATKCLEAAEIVPRSTRVIFEDMPNFVLSSTFQFMNNSTAANFERTCRKWRCQARLSGERRSIVFDEHQSAFDEDNIGFAFFHERNFSGLVSITWRSTMPIGEQLKMLISSAPALKRLVLELDRMDNEHTEAIFGSLQKSRAKLDCLELISNRPCKDFRCQCNVFGMVAQFQSSVKRLKLDCWCNRNTSHLQALVNLHDLTDLDLVCGGYVKDEHMQWISGLSQIRKLSLYKVVKDFSLLSPLRALTDLTVGSCQSFVGLSNLSSLVRLSVGAEDRLDHLDEKRSDFDSLVRLRELHLGQKLRDLRVLSGLRSLERLSCLNLDSLSGIEVLQGLTHVSVFHRLECPIRDVVCLHDLHSATTVIVPGRERRLVEYPEFQFIAKLPQLRQFSFNMTGTLDDFDHDPKTCEGNPTSHLYTGFFLNWLALPSQ
jgi:hypothetical protein